MADYSSYPHIFDAPVGETSVINIVTLSANIHGFQALIRKSFAVGLFVRRVGAVNLYSAFIIYNRINAVHNADKIVVDFNIAVFIRKIIIIVIVINHALKAVIILYLVNVILNRHN